MHHKTTRESLTLASIRSTAGVNHEKIAELDEQNKVLQSERDSAVAEVTRLKDILETLNADHRRALKDQLKDNIQLEHRLDVIAAERDEVRFHRLLL